MTETYIWWKHGRFVLFWPWFNCLQVNSQQLQSTYTETRRVVVIRDAVWCSFLFPLPEWSATHVCDGDSSFIHTENGQQQCRIGWLARFRCLHWWYFPGHSDMLLIEKSCSFSETPTIFFNQPTHSTASWGATIIMSHYGVPQTRYFSKMTMCRIPLAMLIKKIVFWVF